VVVLIGNINITSIASNWIVILQLVRLLRLMRLASISKVRPPLQEK
jgi:hypothetical protein